LSTLGLTCRNAAFSSAVFAFISTKAAFEPAPYLFLRLRVGFPLRFVFAILRSSALLIDLYIPREAPLSDDLERLPRLAASAAPAAICCFFDFAGIQK
jgi:hypothetical protein